MPRQIADLSTIAAGFDAIVLDQWGVLHDGSAPYPGAVEAVRDLSDNGVRLAVLSNSGKRGDLNARRIADIGFPASLFELVLTSGEALWQDLSAGAVTFSRLLPVERELGDAADFLDGLNVALVDNVDHADAALLMGLPDDAAPDDFAEVFNDLLARDLPVICTNPDRAAPRTGGRNVVSPGCACSRLRRTRRASAVLWKAPSASVPRGRKGAGMQPGPAVDGRGQPGT